MLSNKFFKILEIVTFDFGYHLVNKSDRKKIKDEIKEKFIKAELKEIEFNSQIYDCEFIRVNEDKKAISISGEVNGKNIKNIISSYKNSLSEDEKDNFDSFKRYFNLNKINYRIVLDSYGIGTIRIEFDLIKNNIIDTIDIIKSTKAAGKLVDKYLFPNYFKEKFLKLLNTIFKEKIRIILEEKHTYPIIATNRKQNFSKEELYGIVWKDKDYKEVKKNVIDEIVNDIAMENKDNFIISQPATFMRFLNSNFEKPYFQNRINALEILRRQHHLLKGFDFQLSEIIEKKEKSNLSLLLNRIRKIQDNVFLLSEFYKNIKIAVMQEYKYIFKRVNEIFGINDLYESLKLKIDWSYNITNDLIQERRNYFFKGINIAAFLIGSITFIKNIVDPILAQIVPNLLNRIFYDILLIILFTFMIYFIIFKILFNRILKIHKYF